ncbi:GNAT family N-acetyltransferase [Balneatrix alpica]|uniref:GNAT family N-acetyltransferase n=1 Tax=Balneatrix alpica TaxID=75684 RepID=A0ABV5ZAQ2_9GAMM|nr:GNAT family N-acetyltransferase [Balneatrix alpica]
MIQLQVFQAERQQEVIDLILPIQQQEFGLDIDLARQPDLTDIAGFYQQGCGNFWLALHQQQLVGCVGLLDIGQGQAALRKMFVATPYRGSQWGVANRLLQQLLQWAQQQSLRDLYLGTTAQFHAAQRFYHKQGFTLIDPQQLPASFPRMAVDSLFYHYPVNR